MQTIIVTRKSLNAVDDLRSALAEAGITEHPSTYKITFSILTWYQSGKLGLCVSTDAIKALERYPNSCVALSLEEDGFLYYAPKKARRDELTLVRKGSASSRKGLRDFTFRLRGRAGSETTVAAKSVEEAVRKVASYPHYCQLGRCVETYEMERLAPNLDFSD